MTEQRHVVVTGGAGYIGSLLISELLRTGVAVTCVDSLLFGLVPSVGRYMPSQAAEALAGSSVAHALPAAAGGAVLVAWTVALAVAGVVLVAKRDVE